MHRKRTVARTVQRIVPRTIRRIRVINMKKDDRDTVVGIPIYIYKICMYNDIGVLLCT